MDGRELPKKGRREGGARFKVLRIFGGPLGWDYTFVIGYDRPGRQNLAR